MKKKKNKEIDAPPPIPTVHTFEEFKVDRTLESDLKKRRITNSAVAHATDNTSVRAKSGYSSLLDEIFEENGVTIVPAEETRAELSESTHGAKCEEDLKLAKRLEDAYDRINKDVVHLGTIETLFEMSEKSTAVRKALDENIDKMLETWQKIRFRYAFLNTDVQLHLKLLIQFGIMPVDAEKMQVMNELAQKENLRFTDEHELLREIESRSGTQSTINVKLGYNRIFAIEQYDSSRDSSYNNKCYCITTDGGITIQSSSIALVRFEEADNV